MDDEVPRELVLLDDWVLVELLLAVLVDDDEIVDDEVPSELVDELLAVLVLDDDRLLSVDVDELDSSATAPAPPIQNASCDM